MLHHTTTLHGILRCTACVAHGINMQSLHSLATANNDPDNQLAMLSIYDHLKCVIFSVSLDLSSSVPTVAPFFLVKHTTPRLCQSHTLHAVNGSSNHSQRNSITNFFFTPTKIFAALMRAKLFRSLAKHWQWINSETLWFFSPQHTSELQKFFWHTVG